MAGATYEKAALELASGSRIPCMFNPESYTISKANDWRWSPVKGAAVPPVEYGGGAPQLLTVRLLLDVTLQPKDKSVASYVDALMSLSNLPPGSAAGGAKSVPPFVTFRWGKRSFKGVVAEVRIKMTVFRANGDPARAWVDLALLQAEQTTPKGQNPTTQARPEVEVRTVQDGDTLHSLAYQSYGDATRWRVIAEFNNIDNPVQLKRGQELSIPTVIDQ